MNKTWVAISITNYGMNDSMNYGHIYVSCDDGFELSHRVSFEEAVKEMAKLAKALGRPPKLITNWYGSSISYRELSGYVNRE